MGISALSELTIDATHWRSAYWAEKKGLFNMVFNNTSDMDAYVDIIASNLSGYSLEAMRKMKEVLWENTDSWDELLLKRAELSGKLVLSKETRMALEKFKK